VQPETADQNRTVLGSHGMQGVAVHGCPTRSVASRVGLQHRHPAGLPVNVVVDGAPRELAPLVDQSAYRIVQEAVTNVVKHADRAPTTITLGYGDRALELTIADEGEVSMINHRGHGLVGMRERAELFGGTLEAGPCDGQGFEVKAVLPYR